MPYTSATCMNRNLRLATSTDSSPAIEHGSRLCETSWYAITRDKSRFSHSIITHLDCRHLQIGTRRPTDELFGASYFLPYSPFMRLRCIRYAAHRTADSIDGATADDSSLFTTSDVELATRLLPRKLGSAPTTIPFATNVG